MLASQQWRLIRIKTIRYEIYFPDFFNSAYGLVLCLSSGETQNPLG